MSNQMNIRVGDFIERLRGNGSPFEFYKVKSLSINGITGVNTLSREEVFIPCEEIVNVLTLEEVEMSSYGT